MLYVILTLIIIVNAIFAGTFVVDLAKHKGETLKEPGNPILLAIWSAILFFLSTFGISDFALSTVAYTKSKLVSDKKLPGTLNTQCVIPVAAMALAYISVIKVDKLTLILCIIAQVIGAYIGPKLVVKFKAKTIRMFVSIGLIIAALFILAGKFKWIPSGGNLTGLSGWKLVIAIVTLFIYGALNNVGIGSYAPTMATIYALGMSPAVAFPIMMGACTFSVPVGSTEFIKYGEYSKKITLFTSIFGLIGVLIAVYIVKNLNVSVLQWIIAVVILYSGITMLLKEIKNRKEIAM